MMNIIPEHIIKNEAFIRLYAWMTYFIELKLIDLIIFAIVYSFHKERKAFYGNILYLQAWTHTSQKTVYNSLNYLIDNRYIEKVETVDERNRKCCEYRISQSKLKEIEEEYLHDTKINDTRPVESTAANTDIVKNTKSSVNFTKSQDDDIEYNADSNLDEKKDFVNSTNVPVNSTVKITEDSENFTKSQDVGDKKPIVNITKDFVNITKDFVKFTNLHIYNNKNNNIKDTDIPPIPPKGVDAGVDPGADNFDPMSSIPDASTPTSSIPTSSTPTDPSLESYIRDTDHETEYYDTEYGCRQEYKYHLLDGIDDNPNPNWYSETAEGYEEVIAAYNLPRDCLGITEQTPIPEDWYKAINPDPASEPSPQEQENMAADQTDDDGLDDVDRFEIWVKEQEQKERDQKEKQLKEQLLQGENVGNDVSDVKTVPESEKSLQNDVPVHTPILRPQMEQSDSGNIKPYQTMNPLLKAILRPLRG